MTRQGERKKDRCGKGKWWVEVIREYVERNRKERWKEGEKERSVEDGIFRRKGREKERKE